MPLCYKHWIVATLPRVLPDALRAAYEADGESSAPDIVGNDWWRVMSSFRFISTAKDAAQRREDINLIEALKLKVFAKAIEELSTERDREFSTQGNGGRASAAHV